MFTLKPAGLWFEMNSFYMPDRYVEPFAVIDVSWSQLSVTLSASPRLPHSLDCAHQLCQLGMTPQEARTSTVHPLLRRPDFCGLVCFDVP